MPADARVAAVALVLAGCAAAAVPSDHGQLIRRIVPTAVQLRAEREDGGRRAASGVVIAADPETRQSWVITTRHFLEPPAPQTVYVSVPGRTGRLRARLLTTSQDNDLAVLEVIGIVLPTPRLKDIAHVGDDVWIVAFPWGRRLTVVSGIISQVAADDGVVPLAGPARLIDASVSYGSSGGGVFDAVTGALLGIVEGYRTAKFKVRENPDRVIDVPVPGETTVIPAAVIIRFLETAGLPERVRR
jgi:S1-C subfamily serine protease